MARAYQKIDQHLAMGYGESPFIGIPSFARLPVSRSAKMADVMVVGIPFDSGTSYRSGARFGPQKIREISCLVGGDVYSFEYEIAPFGALRVLDYGDIPVLPPSIEKTYRCIERECVTILREGAKIVALGGDQSISLPLLRAYRKVYGPVNLVRFDAHTDTWSEEMKGIRFSHGTPFHWAHEERLIQKHIIVGVRGYTWEGDRKDANRKGAKIVTANDVHFRYEETFLSFQKLLKEFHGPTFVSFDVDVLDPAFAPGTGTPEPGGLTSTQASHLFTCLSALENPIGLDVVEVNPLYDRGEITALFTSRIILDFLCILAKL